MRERDHNMPNISGVESELDGIQTAITVDLCGDIEELRVRVGQVRQAIESLRIPAYIAAISLAAIAFRLS